MRMSADAVRPLVGDLRQYASVRRIELDDGPERGVRALAFSTGGGLDFWALADRSLDIGTLTWLGQPIAWQSATGFRSPLLHDAESDHGRGFLRSFSGMLVTCGLESVGTSKSGQPLHGRLPYTPARLLSYGEDWDREEPVLFCEGQVDQVMHLEEAIRLRRRIEAPVGGTTLRIADTVTNLGTQRQEHQLLYHVNVGWPALSETSRLTLNDVTLASSFKQTLPGTARSSLCFPSGSGPASRCTLSLPSMEGVLTVQYDATTLPFLQVWQDLQPNRNVVALEPCTTDFDTHGSGRSVIAMEPGESRTYSLEMSLSRATLA